MTEKFRNIISRLLPLGALIGLLLIWQLVCVSGWVEAFLLPSPAQVLDALISEFPRLMVHAKITLSEAFIGLTVGVLFGFIMAVVMDWFTWVRLAFYPLMVISQTIPTVAIAPLLVLWFGYEMTPKIILIVLTTFFPIAVGLLSGFQAADTDAIRLLQSMGAGKLQIFRYIKLPGAQKEFFSGLRISVSYAIVGAVISEWIGGFGGLGVYMTRVKKAYAFDKMFAVIFLIAAISLICITAVDFLQKKLMPWERKTDTE